MLGGGCGLLEVKLELKQIDTAWAGYGTSYVRVALFAQTGLHRQHLLVIFIIKAHKRHTYHDFCLCS